MNMFTTVQSNFFSFYKTWQRLSLEKNTPWDYESLEKACKAAITKSVFHSACEDVETALIKIVNSCTQCKSRFKKWAGNVKHLDLGAVEHSKTTNNSILDTDGGPDKVYGNHKLDENNDGDKDKDGSNEDQGAMTTFT